MSSAHVVHDLDVDLAVAEPAHHGAPSAIFINSQIFSGEPGVAVARE